MVATRTLTDHEEIRDWAAARMGAPAIQRAAAAIADAEPTLFLKFGQQVYEGSISAVDAERTIGDLEFVEWDEWFEIFDRKNLALVVAEEQPGVKDSFHELVVRPD